MVGYHRANLTNEDELSSLARKFLENKAPASMKYASLRADVARLRDTLSKKEKAADASRWEEPKMFEGYVAHREQFL
jgi:hypothetical protein